MLVTPPCGASSNIALWRAKIKPPVELVVGDLAFKVNSYVIISQKDLPFSGTIEIQNLKGEQSIGKKNGKCR